MHKNIGQQTQAREPFSNGEIVLRYTGLFISPSGISELDCATTTTDTAERSISIGRESPQFFFCARGLGLLQGSTTRGWSWKKWRSQWIRKRSVSWNLPKLSQLWLCNGGFGSCSTQNHLQTKQSPGKETGYVLYRRLGGPQGRSGRLRKISPSTWFNPRTVQPVSDRYTNWAIPAP